MLRRNQRLYCALLYFGRFVIELKFHFELFLIILIDNNKISFLSITYPVNKEINVKTVMKDKPDKRVEYTNFFKSIKKNIYMIFPL